jgi:2-hydroxy-6-oxonona-2,4-dienedioate hydrolase
VRRAALAGVAAFAAIAAALLAAERDVDARREILAAQARTVQTPWGIVEYAETGTGPPVLVFHGAGGGFDQGLLLARALGGGGHRWIAISRFGYLGSTLPPDGSTAAQAAAALAVLEHLGIERVDILAMSGGVPPALQFASAYPERTGRLVLLSSAPFTPSSADVEGRPVPDWVYRKLLASDHVYWLLTKVARSQLETAFDARKELLLAAPPEEIGFIDELVDGFLPASARVAGVANEGAAVDPAARYPLERIRAPSLIVHARDDALNPYAVAQTLDRRIPDSRLIAVDRGGHLLLGHHASLRRRIAEFLAS